MGNVIALDAETANFSYADHADRLCRHFVKAKADHFSNDDIVELLLFACGAGVNAKTLAAQLLASFGSFTRIITASADELGKISGIDERLITVIKLVQESALRLLKEDVTDTVILNNKTALFQYCKAKMRHLKVEQFHVFYLNRKLHLIADEIVSEGTIDHTPVYPREVVKRTLDLGATSIILAHNHPSGDPRPSEADKRITRDISMALATMGIDVIDHVVIGGSRHFSFLEHGLM